MRYNKYIISFVCVLLALQVSSQVLKITRTYVDLQPRQHCIDDLHPVFGWQLSSPEFDVTQTAWQLFIGTDSLALLRDRADVYQGAKILSQSSLRNSYDGPALQPARVYYWKTRVWDNHQHVATSSIQKIQTGLPGVKDWGQATWIGFEEIPDSLIVVPAEHQKGRPKWQNRNDVLPLLRKTFTSTKPIRSATAFVSGLGQFELYVNGQKISDHFLDPGWTKYDKEAQYIAFDVKPYVKNGLNTIGAMLGNGFYFVPGIRYRKLSGAFGYPKLKMKMVLTYTDGSSEEIVSDGSWKAAEGPIRVSSIYGGEDYDATKALKGWSTAAYNDAAWRPAQLVKGPARLYAMNQEPMKLMASFQARLIKQIDANTAVYDMGQNASAIFRIQVKGSRGDTIRITTAELLKEDGTVNQKPIGSPIAFNYICSGEPLETWQPRFTYTGFRYIQMQMIPAGAKRPVLVKLTGLHVRNSAAQQGSFASSDTLFNKTFELIRWAIRSNMASILTDCPHREKLGWLEQTHLMGNSIAYNYDMLGLYRKMVRDMMTAQQANGRIPEYVPEYVDMPFMNGIFQDSPEWGSAAVLLPWFLYEWYGDKSTLEAAWPMMKKFIDHLAEKANDHIVAYGLSDWYDLGPEKPGLAQLTPMGVTGTATYYQDLQVMSHSAAVLGYIDDSLDFARMSDTVRQAFNAHFFHADSAYYATGSQTANAMALALGLVPDGYEERVLESLIRDIRNRNNQLTSGDVGFHYLVEALDKMGRSDLLFQMNHRTDVPGYGYQIAKGATALTESWQALPTVSNNHLMLGHLMQWFYEGVVGITQSDSAVAFQQLILRPQLPKGIRHANAGYESLYGPVKLSWQKKNKELIMNITVSVNSTARLMVPLSGISGMFVNGMPEGLQIYNSKQGMRIERTLGSGQYQIVFQNYAEQDD